MSLFNSCKWTNGFVRLVQIQCLAALTFALVLLCTREAHAGIADLFSFGGESGKLAKFEFRLKDSFDVTSIVWSPDGKFIAGAGTFSNRIHIWDVERRTVAKEIALGVAQPFFHNLAWSPDGRYFATGDSVAVAGKSHAFLRLIDTTTWQDVRHLGDGSGRMIAFSSDSKQVAVLGRNLTVYSTEDGHVIKVSKLQDGWGRAHIINAITYLPGTYTLLIGGEQPEHIAGKPWNALGLVWFLGPTEDVPTRSIKAYTISDKSQPTPVVSLTISPDGNDVATGARTGSGAPPYVTESVHVFRISDNALLGAPLDGVVAHDGIPFGAQTGLTYTPDGNYIVAGHEQSDGAIHLIETKTFKVVDIVHTGNFVYDVAVDPKNNRFAAGTGKQIVVWSLPIQH